MITHIFKFGLGNLVGRETFVQMEMAVKLRLYYTILLQVINY